MMTKDDDKVVSLMQSNFFFTNPLSVVVTKYNDFLNLKIEGDYKSIMDCYN